MKLLIGLLGCIVIFYFSALNWRNTVKFLLFLVVIEGALRKWVLPQASEMIYFLKDLVVLGAYFNFYGFSGQERKLALKGSLINTLIFITIGWCVFQVFNPSLGSPLVGIFGLRGYVLYIPLIWMLPTLFESEEELRKFLRSHLLLLIPVGLIGIVQFFSPASSPINAYAAEEASAVTFGSGVTAVRITGTFSFISGYASYLMVCFGLLISLLAIHQTWKWKIVTIAELFLLIVNSFMTGSRAVIFTEVLFLAGYLVARGFRQPGSTLNFIRRLLLPTLVIAIAAFIGFRPAIDAFWTRTTVNQDVSGRITDSFMQPLTYMQYKELDGYGTGATHQAAPMLRQALNLPTGEVIPVGYESEMGRIVLELGPIGFVFWYGLRVSLALALLVLFWKLKRPFLRQLALVAFLIQASQINSQLVFHHTFSVYYWFLSSFIFLLPRLEEIENWHKEQQLLQEYVQSSYFPDSPYR